MHEVLSFAQGSVFCTNTAVDKLPWLLSYPGYREGSGYYNSTFIFPIPGNIKVE